MILALELCLPKATRGRIFTRTSKHLGNLEHFRQKHLGNLEHFEQKHLGNWNFYVSLHSKSNSYDKQSI